jgi:alpha-ketoglutarate-dependent taurine dioxygenase/pyoverdine/dityrosine biosynthesis protein Dit1
MFPLQDLLHVSDETVWKYGEALRQMAVRIGCTSIHFSRISQMPGLNFKGIPANLITNLNGEKYQKLAPLARRKLVEQYGEPNFDVDAYIASDPAVKSTYLGYLKFLELDLAGERVTSSSSEESESSMEKKSESRKAFRKRIQVIAKKMISRGKVRQDPVNYLFDVLLILTVPKCFATLIKEAYGSSVRLSIHPGNATYKIPISVLPNLSASDSKCITAWHSSMVCRLDGTFTAMHRKDVDHSQFELQYRDGRPWCYREISSLFDWGQLRVNFDYIQPCGLIITPVEPDTSFDAVDMMKLRQLSEHCSPVILRGFKGATNRELFIGKGREMGPITPWKFGELLEVKDGGENAQGLNNVLSSEPMPYHYDGLFKKVNGKSTPPRYVVSSSSATIILTRSRFQMFTAKVAGPKGTGHTLFATSRLIFQHLPSPYTPQELEKHTWSVATMSFEKTVMGGLPLVIRHPTQSIPVLRYHEDWPKEKTRFDETRINIEDVSPEEDQSIRKALDSTLYDRRVVLRVSWEEGDVLISDNISTMHTRDGYGSGQPRELWRLHID